VTRALDGASWRAVTPSVSRLRHLLVPGLLALVVSGCAVDAEDQAQPLRHEEVVEAMTLVNDRFLATSPAPSDAWNRAVYFEGVVALAAVSDDVRATDEAERWAESHAWGLHGGASTRFADDQCAGQTYLDLYARDHDDARIREVVASVDAMVQSERVTDWTWVDALHMAMPLFARIGVLRHDARYFEKMHELYAYARNVVGGGLFSPADHLWFRDATFVPPYAEPNGASCYWSRGNGWAYSALARVLDVLPESDAHRKEYLADFVAMSEALRAVVREDGFWNVSLHDPTHFGGKELTGTSLFTYGMAWGVAKHVLPAATYAPLVERAWKAMARTAVHPDGRLGYVQGTGTRPGDRMPVSYDSTPNVEDFGVGCFLLAGSAVATLVGR
jgi:unsaturated rhamnogalacturonyl hydrolase